MHLMPRSIEIIGVVVRPFKRGEVIKTPRFNFNRPMPSGYRVIILNRDGSESVFSTHSSERAAIQDRDLVLDLIA